MVSSKIKEQAAKWVMAKGLGVTVLIIMQIVSMYVVTQLWKAQRELQTQMFHLQNEVIKDNTKALYQFNTITQNHKYKEYDNE